MLLRAVLKCCVVVPLTFGIIVPPLRAQTAIEIQHVIATASGYSANTIEVKTEPVQIIVTIVNSELNGSLITHRERETEATQIVDAFAGLLGKTILTVHIDYVSRQPGSQHTDIVDAIDFRRNSVGKFEIHRT